MGKKAKELIELLDFYENELCNLKFKYQLNNKWDIEIVFYVEDFCHLLGIQHVHEKDKRYLGMSGYEKIKNKTLTRRSLKQHNEKGYNYIKIKLEHFDEIRNMMSAGEFIKFYQYKVEPPTTIVADFIIYQDNKEYILHLFLRRGNEKSNQYNPISFIVKSIKDKNRDQYIKGQEHKKITKFEIINLKQSKGISE